MSAKHRMPESPEQMPTSTDHGQRRVLSGAAKVCDIISASLLCAACLTALVLNVGQHEKRSVAASLEPPAISQPVSQEGTVVAVSADSVTMRGADGHIQTYHFTPNTTVVTHGARQPITAAPHFTINDKVIVVGTIEGGTALATAVAYRGAGHGEAPPMDNLDGQAVSAGAA
ncbi:hypothetical protein MYSE111917_07260 [Mycobacterium senriense]|uniref:DUF5666 domain-containing protein n=1 Tax=Mycobacterium senriense TaxID=2775496 RepID=A0ABM7SPT2_9MYCO|nr:hypothetical protein [Mycobacterium senriense]BCZ22152.1 hypothetical protein MTY59_20070 [Mycobacterium senriense]